MFKKLPLNVFSALLSLTLAVGFFFWAFEEEDSDAPRLFADQEQAPGWYWYNARFWNFDSDGQLEQVATAIDVKHFDEDDRTLLSEPRVTSYTGDDQPWLTRAARGETRRDNEIIELFDNVVIYKDDGSFNLQTEQLMLTRSTEVAQSSVAVALTSENSRTTAVGMRAWLKKEKVELLSKVKTVHEPK